MKNRVKQIFPLLGIILLAAGCSKERGLSGTWMGNNYQCNGTYNEEVRIEQSGTSITATKITGDPCVPAGNVTFTGTKSGTDTYAVTCTVGTPSNPASSTNTGTLTVVDDNTLKVTGSGMNVTYIRQ